MTLKKFDTWDFHKQENFFVFVHYYFTQSHVFVPKTFYYFLKSLIAFSLFWHQSSDAQSYKKNNFCHWPQIRELKRHKGLRWFKIFCSKNSEKNHLGSPSLCFAQKFVNFSKKQGEPIFNEFFNF